MASVVINTRFNNRKAEADLKELQSVPTGTLEYAEQVYCGTRLPLFTRWTYILEPQSAQYIRPVKHSHYCLLMPDINSIWQDPYYSRRNSERKMSFVGR